MHFIKTNMYFLTKYSTAGPSLDISLPSPNTQDSVMTQLVDSPQSEVPGQHFRLSTLHKGHQNSPFHLPDLLLSTLPLHYLMCGMELI